MPDLVAIGESLALLTAPRPGRLRDQRTLELSMGGAEANVAIGVARLGHSACWVGRVGDDEFGALIRATLRSENVDDSCVSVDPAAPTALMVKERRGNAITKVVYYRHGSAGSRLARDQLDRGVIGSARVLHLSGITLGVSETCREAAFGAAELARSAGALVSFDFNYRVALWPADAAAPEFRKLAAIADLVFAGEDELALLGRGDPVATARELCADGSRAVVIKRGSRGAARVSAAGEDSVRATPVQVVDPVGAGDAFVAGYLSGILDGLDGHECLVRAAACGAHAVAGLGDWEAMPGRDDLGLLLLPGETTLR
jgi:2-dehydro-3-deoxygluconokinase